MCISPQTSRLRLALTGCPRSRRALRVRAGTASLGQALGGRKGGRTRSLPGDMLLAWEDPPSRSRGAAAFSPSGKGPSRRRVHGAEQRPRSLAGLG